MSLDIFQHLKEEFQNKDGTFTPAFIEEYIVESDIDYRYVAKKFNTRITKSEALRACQQQFETISFRPSREYENEVSFKDFQAHYEFGKYPNTRGWITYFEKTIGEVLTREKLYEYIRKLS